jgi:phosphatidylserine/phosphatidylglycerophosphate/cardiolipin synthase-like enzyme
MIRRLRLSLKSLVCLLMLAAAGCSALPTVPARVTAAATAPAATAAAATSAPDAAPASASWYHLYFTDPATTGSVTNPSGGIPEAIAASFDAAHRTIDVAVYEFDLKVLSQALLKAKARGVKVRVVTDSDSVQQAGIQALIAGGVPVIPDKRDPIMHDKFVVIDGARLWSGSMNFTVNDAYRNDNNMIEIESPELAQNYTHEFERMFLTKKFTKHAAGDTPHPSLTIDGTEIDNYFSPGGGVASHINAALGAAQHNIYFMAFSFTRKDLGQTLLDQANAGRDVRGVFEGLELAANGTAVWNMLTKGGLAADIRQDGNSHNMHNKVFIVDKDVVVTGSYNFSASAENDNNENSLIIHNAAIGAAYYAQFERIWAEGK